MGVVVSCGCGCILLGLLNNAALMLFCSIQTFFRFFLTLVVFSLPLAYSAPVAMKARSLQRSTSVLREDLRGMRKDYMTQMSSFLNCMRGAGDQIMAAMNTLKALG